MRRLGCVSSLLVSLVWARGEPIGRILFRFSPVVSVSAGRDSCTSISDLNLEQTGTLIDEATGRKMMQGDSKIEWIGQREFQRVKKKAQHFLAAPVPLTSFSNTCGFFCFFPSYPSGMLVPVGCRVMHQDPSVGLNGWLLQTIFSASFFLFFFLPFFFFFFSVRGTRSVAIMRSQNRKVNSNGTSNKGEKRGRSRFHCRSLAHRSRNGQGSVTIGKNFF